MKFIILFFASLFIPIIASANMDDIHDVGEPLGIRWGMSLEEARPLFGEILDRKILGKFTIITPEKTPKKLVNEPMIALFFHEEYGLSRVDEYTKGWRADSHGVAGQIEYNRVKNILDTLYGEPKTDQHWTGLKRYGGENEFYQCLSDPECGMWQYTWEESDLGKVSLALKGMSKAGYLELKMISPYLNAMEKSYIEAEAKASAETEEKLEKSEDK